MTADTKSVPWDTSWYPVPQGHGICPVCNGSTHVELTDEEKTKSWNKGYTHRTCTNCGGQDMSGKAKGHTPLNPATGKGCHHSYTGRPHMRWKCYTIYTCNHGCGHTFDIDSGD